MPGSPEDPPDGNPKVEPPVTPPPEEQPLHKAEELQLQMNEQFGERLTKSFAHNWINGIGGEDQEARLEKFGQQNGLPNATAIAHEVYDQYQAQAVDYVSKQTGEDGMKILQWARGQFDTESWQQVARLHFLGRRMDGYDAIIHEYRKMKG